MEEEDDQAWLVLMQTGRLTGSLTFGGTGREVCRDVIDQSTTPRPDSNSYRRAASSIESVQNYRRKTA